MSKETSGFGLDSMDEILKGETGQEQEPKSLPRGMGRREFLRTLGAGAVLFGAEQGLGSAAEQLHKKKYLTGWLAGKKLGDLYAVYIGINGVIPATAEIDFYHQLSLMWERKNRRSGQNSVVVDTGKKILKDYKEKTVHTMPVRAYHNMVESNLKATIEHMDWDKLGQIKGLSPEKLKLVRNICLSVNARHLLAYCLTELMPSSDGRLNVEVFNFLLESAGREYIESIPAMYDKKTSFGPYQFTEFALFDDGHERRGASVPNLALKKDRLPGSVTKLRGMDHHKAGYLFMVDNFSNLVKRLTPKELKVLAGTWKDKQNDLVSYAATAHHGPAVALNIARRWLDNGARLPYSRSCGRVYGLYAHKTEANFGALKTIAQ